MYHNRIRSTSTYIKTDIQRDLDLFFKNYFKEPGDKISRKSYITNNIPQLDYGNKIQRLYTDHMGDMNGC